MVSTMVVRNVLLPQGRVRATLLVVNPYDKDYVALDIRRVRLLPSNDLYMELEYGFHVTLPVESVYDVSNRRGNHILYIVFSKTPIQTNGDKLLRFEPYDYTITQALADVGDKNVVDKLTEEISRYRKLAEEAKSRVLLKVTEDGLKHLEAMDEMVTLLKRIIDALITNKIDEARALVTDKLTLYIDSFAKRYSDITSKVNQHKESIIKMLEALGYKREELEKLTLDQLIKLLEREVDRMVRREVAVAIR